MPKPLPPEPKIKPRDRHDPLAYHEDSLRWYSKEEWAEIQKWQQECLAIKAENDREEWEQETRGKLCLELYRKFQEYKTFVEQHPWASRTKYGGDLKYPEHVLFAQALEQVQNMQRQRAEKDRQNLEKARLAARCEHEFVGGGRCGSPKMKEGKFCFQHEQMETAKTAQVDLGILEDPDSIQMAIQKLQKVVIEDKLAQKQISHLMYLIQLAAWNVTRTKIGMRALEDGSE